MANADPSAITTTTTTTTIPLKPTKIFWVAHHTGFTKTIRIFDITGPTHGYYDPAVGLDDAFKSRAKNVANRLRAKQKSDAEVYRIERQNWQMTQYLMYLSSSSSHKHHTEPETQTQQPKANRKIEQMHLLEDENADALEENLPQHQQLLNSGGAIAHWQAPWCSSGDSTLSFPAQSGHSSHNLTLKPVKWYRRTETFVKDSVQYSWEPQHRWHSRRFALVRQQRVMVGGAQVRKEVARLAMVWNWEWGSGGVLAVDDGDDSEGGVDQVVAVLGALVMLKKKSQRDAERSNHGGGGGALLFLGIKLTMYVVPNMTKSLAKADCVGYRRKKEIKRKYRDFPGIERQS